MALLLASVSLASPLRAQAVRGIVRDSISAQPLAGAVVVLLDQLNAPVARTITDPAGQFRLAAPGARKVRVLRLGFRPRELALTAADFGGPLALSLLAIPILLEPVHARAAASCPGGRSRERALALLEQVRLGLLATIVARSAHPGQMTRALFERRLEGTSGRVGSQVVRVERNVVVERSFMAARSGAQFVRDGFVDEGTSTFFAPEAETLIDEEFAAGYCFHVARGDRRRPTQVGLGFEPARRRAGRVDVEGILWVDTLARALRDLEFLYVGLHPRLAPLKPGGRLSFGEMPNGTTTIDRWSLRLVSGEIVTGPRGARGDSRLFVHENGGELLAATWPGGYSWRAPVAALRLQARTRTAEPARGLVVRLEGTDYGGVTDSTGTLLVEDLLPGPYRVVVEDRRLRQVGVLIETPLRFTAVRDSTITAVLQARTAEEYVLDRCRAAGPKAWGSWVFGRVEDGQGRPVGGAAWAIRAADGSPLANGGCTGSDGLFHWCELAPGERVVLEAEAGGLRASAPVALKAGLTVARLVLAPTAPPPGTP